MSAPEGLGVLASSEVDLLPPMSPLEIKQAALYFSLCCARECRKRMESRTIPTAKYLAEKMDRDLHLTAARAQAADVRAAGGLDDLIEEMLQAEGIEP